MWFTRVSINNPVFATMMMVGLLVLGLFSIQRLGVDQFPDINFPVVVVTTLYPGASPEAVETDITRKVEEAVNTISGIKTLTSRSYEGQSVVIAEFDLFTSPVVAAQDVREKVAALRPVFRDEVKDPVVSRFNPDDQPIVSVSVRSEQRGLRELSTLSDQVVVKRIENAHGVGKVTLVGGVKREVQLLLRPADMEALGVGVDQVMNAVRQENQELPAGAVTGREAERLVKVQGRILSVPQFRDIIVARRAGTPVYLWQVATVVDGQQEEENVALVNGVRALAIDVVKTQGANTIEVVDAVRVAVKDLERTLPPDVKLAVVRDTSIGIRNSVANVRHTIIEGGALAIVIVFLFLNSWRSTVITGLTLPIALIGTFVVLYIFGFTINVMTLMALSLCVGLLIDDAIVVRENIVRHVRMGKPHRQASLDGTQEIGLAVMATTFTICAVFVPVAFMGGIIGRFFFQFGITVTAAVLLSMFVSFTLDPMLSSIWPDPPHDGRRRGPIGRLFDAFEHGVERVGGVYQGIIRWSLKWRKTTVLLALASLVVSFLMVRFIGSEFLPEADLSEILVQMNTPAGSSLAHTQEKAKQVEAALREFPEVEYTYATVNTGFVQGKNYATVFVRLVPRNARKLPQKLLVNPMRDRILRIAGIEVTYIGQFTSVNSGKPLQVSIQGPDINQLARLSQQVTEAMRRTPGAVDIDSSLKAAKPTIEVRLNRDLASDLGVGVQQIGFALRPLLAGEAVSSWKGPDDQNYDVRVRLSPDDRRNAADLDRLYVTSAQSNADGSPRMVALRQVASFMPTLGATQINRRDLAREVQMTASLYGRPAGDASKDLKVQLDAIELPPGYRFVIGGSAKDIAETMGYAISALLLAVVFIYLILASQFGSFLQPLAIMVSLPLALVGVLLALLAWRSTLNIFSIIGFIMLMGLVTKNAILLVDFINHLRASGMARADAIVEAGKVRLRPILMTTAAMVFGMLPLALGLGEGAEQRAPMAHAVIGGVLASTFLTLLIVPVIFTWLDDLGSWVSRRLLSRPAAPAPESSLRLPERESP